MIRFLFKSVLFLVVIFTAVALLSPDQGRYNQSETSENHSAMDALFVLRNTITDLGSFCKRNPETCKTGKSFLDYLGINARKGARITYEFFTAQFNKAPDSPEEKEIDHPRLRRVIP